MRGIATHPAARGLNDDAAVLDVGGETLVLTHDTMVEGVHFLPDQDPADVAWKLVATNVSDLAAKGAQPVAVLLMNKLLWISTTTGPNTAMAPPSTPLLLKNTQLMKRTGRFSKSVVSMMEMTTADARQFMNTMFLNVTPREDTLNAGCGVDGDEASASEQLMMPLGSEPSGSKMGEGESSEEEGSEVV